ncbi:XRE family transcriptional regulator [Brevibacterium sanguinis]|uniref:XRE family transcriptional regulator n=2 Tax=Brevibacterium TaxID=1696 RepID=A0A366IPQ0_9MICO|nr:MULTISPECIES: XRE family transcriptional regulator [Brevibacterium]RBP68091.1 XRE family transcriptional regulator [Brevibacterium sanguinis]RBP74492.1 XRE family transcriptional regulator [Brevibacterium celere]
MTREQSGISPTRVSLKEIGRRVRNERNRQQLTLVELSEASDTSRSMLSAIERGDRAPTVLVLDRIANALGVSVSRLMTRETHSRVSILRRNEQKIIADRMDLLSEPGYHRRITSPVIEGVEFEMGRLEMNAFVDAGVFSPHQPGWAEYVAVEEGSLEIDVDGEPYRLEAGDAIHFAADCDHAYRNPGATTCVAYIAMFVHPLHTGTNHDSDR